MVNEFTLFNHLTRMDVTAWGTQTELWNYFTIRNEGWEGNKEAKDGLMSFLASRCMTHGSVVLSLGLKHLLLIHWKHTDWAAGVQATRLTCHHLQNREGTQSSTSLLGLPSKASTAGSVTRATLPSEMAREPWGACALTGFSPFWLEPHLNFLAVKNHSILLLFLWAIAHTPFLLLH